MRKQRGMRSIGDRHSVWRWVLPLILLVVGWTCIVLGQSITVEPMQDWVVAGAGAEHNGIVDIVNTGEENVTVSVSACDFLFDEQGGFVELEPGTLGAQSLADSLVFAPADVEIAPGDHAQVRYSFVVPDGNADASRWAALLITPNPVDQEMMSEEDQYITLRTELVVRFAFSILQQPPETAAPMAHCSGMTAVGEGTADEPCLVIEASIANDCAAILPCSAYFEVYDGTGAVIDRWEFPSDRILLPLASRTFEHRFEDLDLAPGTYMALAVFDYGGDALTAGQYRMTIGGSE